MNLTARSKHILLGAGGSIAGALSRELIRQNQQVRLVSRSGSSMEGAESLRADLLDADSVLKAVDAGSTVYPSPVYLTTGGSGASNGRKLCATRSRHAPHATRD